MDEKQPLLQIAGLWAGTSTNGKRYLSGNLGGLRVLVFENRDRRSDKSPTHYLYFQKNPRDGEPRSDAPRNGDYDAPREPRAAPDLDDEIPF